MTFPSARDGELRFDMLQGNSSVPETCQVHSRIVPGAFYAPPVSVLIRLCGVSRTNVIRTLHGTSGTPNAGRRRTCRPNGCIDLDDDDGGLPIQLRY